MTSKRIRLVISRAFKTRNEIVDRMLKRIFRVKTSLGVCGDDKSDVDTDLRL